MSGDSSSVPERLSSLEAKLDLVLQELSGIRAVLGEYEKSQGRQDQAIERHDVELRLIRTIGGWTLGPLFGAFGVGAILAIFYAINK